MNATEIQARLKEPAWSRTAKRNSACMCPKSGAGRCSFDGALLAQLRMADDGWH